MTAKKADALTEEAKVGRKLVLRFDGIDFEIADIMEDRGWMETAGLLADLSGENGIGRMPSAMSALLGEQVELTREWNFGKFGKFAAAVAERINVTTGTPGE